MLQWYSSFQWRCGSLGDSAYVRSSADLQNTLLNAMNSADERSNWDHIAFWCESTLATMLDRALDRRCEIQVRIEHAGNDREMRARVVLQPQQPTHGCGHDAYSAMQVCSARYLAETHNFDGTAALNFKPGEVGFGEDDSMFAGFPVQLAYGMHHRPAMPPRTAGLTAGGNMAPANSVTNRGIVVRNARPIEAAIPSLFAIQVGDLAMIGAVPGEATQLGITRTCASARARPMSAVCTRASPTSTATYCARGSAPCRLGRARPADDCVRVELTLSMEPTLCSPSHISPP